MLKKLEDVCAWLRAVSLWRGSVYIDEFHVRRQFARPELADLALQRVAVCLVGAIRTFVLPTVSKSIKHNLVDVAAGRLASFCISTSWDHTPFAPGMGLHGQAGEPIAANDPHLTKAINLLRPVETKLISSTDCERRMRSLKVCSEYWHAGVQTAVGLAGYLQYMWIARTFESVGSYERANHVSYAWVIRTRPDLAFFDRVPPAVGMSRRMVLMEKESNPAYFDGTFMIPRPLVGDFLSGLTSFWHSRGQLPWPPSRPFPLRRSSRSFPWGFGLIPGALVRSAVAAEASPTVGDSPSKRRPSSSTRFKALRGAAKGQRRAVVLSRGVRRLFQSAWRRARRRHCDSRSSTPANVAVSRPPVHVRPRLAPSAFHTPGRG